MENTSAKLKRVKEMHLCPVCWRSCNCLGDIDEELSLKGSMDCECCKVKLDAKYKRGDDIVISGTLTGLGDQKARVTEVEYEKISRQYFYGAHAADGTRYWAQERYISRSK